MVDEAGLVCRASAGMVDSGSGRSEVCILCTLCRPGARHCSLTGRRDRGSVFPVVRPGYPHRWDAAVRVLRAMSHSRLTCPYGAGTQVECGRIGCDSERGKASRLRGKAGTFRPRKCADRPKDVRGEAHHGRSDHHVGRQRHVRRRRRLVHAAQAADGASWRRTGGSRGQPPGGDAPGGQDHGRNRHDPSTGGIHPAHHGRRHAVAGLVGRRGRTPSSPHGRHTAAPDSRRTGLDRGRPATGSRARGPFDIVPRFRPRHGPRPERGALRQSRARCGLAHRSPVHRTACPRAAARPHPERLSGRCPHPRDHGRDRPSRRQGHVVLLRASLRAPPRPAAAVPGGDGHPAGPPAEGPAHRGRAHRQHRSPRRIPAESRPRPPQVRHSGRALSGGRRMPDRSAEQIRLGVGHGDGSRLGPRVHDDLAGHDRRCGRG